MDEMKKKTVSLRLTCTHFFFKITGGAAGFADSAQLDPVDSGGRRSLHLRYPSPPLPATDFVQGDAAKSICYSNNGRAIQTNGDERGRETDAS